MVLLRVLKSEPDTRVKNWFCSMFWSEPNIWRRKFCLLRVLVRTLRIKEVFKIEPKPEKHYVYVLQNSSPSLILEKKGFYSVFKSEPDTGETNGFTLGSGLNLSIQK